MARMKGRQALMEMLVAQGVHFIFGNPGTTELPLMDALQDYPQVQYILALQEATAVGMADGYARASGTVGVVNLHISAGLANGLSMLYNSYRGGTPLLLTAGQSDTRHILQEPVLWGDLVEMCRQYTKWSAELLHPSDIPTALRRAFRTALTPPTGPVFLSLPWNVLDEEAEVEVVPSSPVYSRLRPDEEALARAVRLLAGARTPVMVVGDRVARSGAVAEAVRVAELLGARVYGPGLHFSEVNFPTGHPQFLGVLNLNYERAVRSALEGADVLLAVGTPLFAQFLYTGPLLDRETQVVHLDISPWDIEKNYPTAVGLWADPKAGLRDLAEALEEAMPASAREEAATRARLIAGEKARQRESFRRRVREAGDREPIAVERVMADLAEVLPGDAIVADEAITSSGALLSAVEFNEPGSYFREQGGALGWGMPGALGVALARPDRTVVGVVGDGSAMYSIQALWTAARYNIPVVYLICNNGSYRILKQYLVNYYYPRLGVEGRRSAYIGMDIDPPVDFARQAEAYGVWGKRITRPKEVRPALEEALSLGRPALVDVLIEPGEF